MITGIQEFTDPTDIPTFHFVPRIPLHFDPLKDLRRALLSLRHLTRHSG